MIWSAYPLAIGAAAACLGYGFGLGRLLGIVVEVGDAGILGIACIAILGCAIHFAFALSPAVQMVTIAVGLALCLVFRNELIRRCRGNLVPILVGLSVFFHRHAFTLFDNRLYHLQSVKWNSEFPIIPGLVNLHMRLAYNSALFILAPLDDRAELGWISNLLVLLFVLTSCYARFSRARRGSVEFWFLGLAVAMLALGTLGPLNWLGVLNADGFAAILAVYCFSVALSLPSRPQTDVPLLLLAGALALTVKLNAAPLFLLAILVAWFHRKTADLSVLKPVAAAAVLLGLWMARGVTLSGCALYPFSPSCIPGLPWGVSRTDAAMETLSIRSWARAPWNFDYAGVLADWTWLGKWSIATWQSASAQLFLLGGIAACVSILAGVRVNRLVMAAFAGLCFCLAYWFWSAPDVRFASGYLAAAGILGLSITCAAYFPGTDLLRRLVLNAVAVSVLLGVAGLVQSGNTWTIKDRPVLASRIAPGGKSIWVTQDGNPGGSDCGDHALPCTPYFYPDRLKRIRWR